MSSLNPRSRPKFAFFGIITETAARTAKEIGQKLGWRAIPLLALLLALAILLSIGAHVPLIAPFVYTLF